MTRMTSTALLVAGLLAAACVAGPTEPGRDGPPVDWLSWPAPEPPPVAWERVAEWSWRDVCAAVPESPTQACWPWAWVSPAVQVGAAPWRLVTTAGAGAGVTVLVGRPGTAWMAWDRIVRVTGPATDTTGFWPEPGEHAHYVIVEVAPPHWHTWHLAVEELSRR